MTLFVERARQLNPGLVADGDSGSLVARLVQRLDGMPLAIELAAARVEALGLTQLLDRIDDRYRLLISANRAATARQRSLEAAVDWSYQLLTADEQRVFRHVSVFPGSFTLDAAEAVAGAEAGLAVLRLVDCSLLVPPATGPDGRSRYLMLETLRGYGLTRLRAAGEEREAAAALAGHALHVAEQAATQMAVRSEERAALLWLDAEEGAVHQGLAWALDHDPRASLRLAVALAPWWLVRGRWIQGYGLLRRAIEQTGPDAGSWYTAHIWLGWLAYGTFDNDASIRHYSVAVDALSGGPPLAILVDALVGRSGVLRNSAGLADAPADARAALKLARQIGYAAGEAMALVELSIIASYVDNGEQAVEWARQARRIDRDLMPGWYARKVELALPYVMVMSGQRDGVPELCTGALAQARAAGDLIDQSDTLFMMAVLARETGRLADARVHLREAVDLATQAGYRMRLIDTLDEGGHWCTATGQYAAAVTLLSARSAQGQATRIDDTPAELREREQPRSAPPGPGKFSARERELITLVAQGQTDAQIAAKLFISVSTVRTHLDRIRDKSGCRRRADLTRLALEEGMI